MVFGRLHSIEDDHVERADCRTVWLVGWLGFNII